MLTRRSVALVTLAIGFVTGSAFVLRSYTSGARETAARPADSRASLELERSRNEEAIERLSKQVAQLRRELDRVEGAAMAAEPTEADAVDSPAPPGPARPSTHEEFPTNEELARPFLDKLKAEAFDPAWARPTEQRIHDAMLDETLRDSSLQSAQCRSSVCEVIVTHSNADAQTMFAEHFERLGPETSEAMCQPRLDDDGEVSTVCYLARPGQPATFTLPADRASAEADLR